MFSISRPNSNDDVIDRAAENTLKILKAGVEQINKTEEVESFVKHEPKKMPTPKAVKKAPRLKIPEERTKDQDLSELLKIAKSLC